jgi:hypothetical protein
MFLLMLLSARWWDNRDSPERRLKRELKELKRQRKRLKWAYNVARLAMSDEQYRARLRMQRLIEWLQRDPYEH